MAHIDCSFFSTSLKKNAHVIVFIPTVSADDYLEERAVDYYKEEKRFPVLYLLHGSYGDCMDWSRFTGIERYAQEKGIAVIMPSGENSSYVNMESGEAYLTYITRELPEFLWEVTEPTAAHWRDPAIMAMPPLFPGHWTEMFWKAPICLI